MRIWFKKRIGNWKLWKTRNDAIRHDHIGNCTRKLQTYKNLNHNISRLKLLWTDWIGKRTTKELDNYAKVCSDPGYAVKPFRQTSWCECCDMPPCCPPPLFTISAKSGSCCELWDSIMSRSRASSFRSTYISAFKKKNRWRYKQYCGFIMSRLEELTAFASGSKTATVYSRL